MLAIFLSLLSLLFFYLITRSVQERKKLSSSLAIRGINASELSVQPQSELLYPFPHAPDYTINAEPPQIITYRPAALRGVWGAPGVIEECSRVSPIKMWFNFVEI